jgi:CheY-like chemotaxis protein
MPSILIADDNPQNLYLLESILKANRFSVVSTHNGAEALDAAQKNPPDLIIADILMPVMDGFELCRRWNADERLRQIPFMFYTATYTESRDEKFALSLGADRFVIKPQKPEVLAKLVGELLEESVKKRPDLREYATSDEMEALRQYNEVLFRKLEKKMRDLEVESSERRRAEERMRLATRKLTLMTDVTFQDIQNKVTALRGFVDLSKKAMNEEDRLSHIRKELAILETIHALIQKTKNYQQMGLDQSRWISLEHTVQLQMSLQSQKEKAVLQCDLHNLELYSDPLIDHVIFNLLQNAIRHGGKTTRITFSCRKSGDGLRVICEDDGIGIPQEQKELIFTRVVGGEGRFGLFFVREFLMLSGMTITETGISGQGARFEILVPDGIYRFPHGE